MFCRQVFFTVALIIGIGTVFQSTVVRAERPFFATDSAVMLEHGHSRLDVGLTYLRLNRNAGTYTVLTELTSGLLNNLDFEVEAPYIFLRRDEADNENGLGDLRLKAKVRFMKGREANPLSLAGQMVVKFPTCDEKKVLSNECTGESDVALEAIASKEFYPAIVHLNLGYTLVGNPPGQAFDDTVRYSLAIDYLSAVETMRVVAEFAGETQRHPDEDSDLLWLLVGLRMAMFAGLTGDLAAAFGLTEATPDFLVTGGLGYPF